MPVIGSTYPDLIDTLKGSAEGTVVEILRQQNPILDDAIAMPCNMGTVHRHTIRTGLPSVSWGRLYQGVAQSKSTLQQVDDTTGFLEAASAVDTRLLKLAKDPAKQRLLDSAPYLEAMNQEMATGIFYHDTKTTPEKFKGVAARYSQFYDASEGITGVVPSSALQVIDGGGQGSDNTSIWFITWGEHATSLLYPDTMKAGVTIEDKGEQRVLDGAGNPYYVKETMFNWHIGLYVKDWRYNARIANIDVSAAMAGDIDLWALLRKAYYRLQSRRRDSQSSRIAIYMNRDILEVLDAQSSDRALTASRNNTANISQATIEGKEVPTYRTIPIRETDALLNTEDLVLEAA